jgi:hypothetical protein
MADVETPQLEVVELPDVEEAVRGTEPLPDASTGTLVASTGSL